MKKIAIILAVAALAACTKSAVEYDSPSEIGFNVVGGNITKAVVDGTTYPTTLNMYVNAYVQDNDIPETPDYIYKGEFTHRGPYNTIVTTATDATDVWGGSTPYYWPNEQKLNFSGFSKAGNVADILGDVTYNPSTDVLYIPSYSPGIGTNEGANDLMWFQSTKYVQNTGYGKATTYVPVNMYHTCSWITFMVQGDSATGGTSSTYNITKLTMNGVDMTGSVTCTGNAALAALTLPTYVVWSDNTTQTGDNTTYNVTLPDGGVSLSNTYTATTANGTTTVTQTPKNIETAATTTTGGNVVVIPQVPGTIDLEWTYKSSTNASISDSATGLSLKVSDIADDNVWKPGVHYIYTITIKANEILVAPTPVDWTDGSFNVTVE